MTAEKFANLAETTLAANYTAGAASISVASAALFPTAGTFRVVVNNAVILTVTAVSGTTFTCTAEAFDANCTAGDTVVLVGTKAVAERFLQSPESGEAVVVSGAAAVDEYWGLWKVRRLDQSSWAWVNQGASSIAQGSGVALFTAANAAGTSLRMRKKAVLTAPYTVEVGLVPRFQGGSFLTNLGGFGLGVRQSGTTEITGLLIANFDFASGNAPVPQIGHVNWNSETSHNSNTALHTLASNTHSSPWPLLPFGIIWLKWVDNNTNYVTSFSYDRINWTTLGTQGRTAFLTADEIGMIGTAQGGTDEAAWYVSWMES